MSSKRSSARLSRNNPSSQTLGEKLHPTSAPYEVPKSIKDGPPPLETQAPLPNKKADMQPAQKAGGKAKKQKLDSTPNNVVSVVIEDNATEDMAVDHIVPNSTTNDPSSSAQSSSTITGTVKPKENASGYNVSEYQAAAKSASSRAKAPLLTDTSVK